MTPETELYKKRYEDLLTKHDELLKKYTNALNWTVVTLKHLFRIREKYPSVFQKTTEAR